MPRLANFLSMLSRQAYRWDSVAAGAGIEAMQLLLKQMLNVKSSRENY
uniref:Uncharacterized protein n=1 Tax=Rheinheimera sp. BAL341 TaxID=1708203 RepID=A0A486XGR7_9GAMM